MFHHSICQHTTFSLCKSQFCYNADFVYLDYLEIEREFIYPYFKNLWYGWKIALKSFGLSFFFVGISKFYSRRECTRSTTNSRARIIQRAPTYWKTPKTNAQNTKPTKTGRLTTENSSRTCCNKKPENWCYHIQHWQQHQKLSRKCRIPQLQSQSTTVQQKHYRLKHSIGFHCHS